ncbi:MAG: hypothetical protein ACLQU3_23965 [Limisphaerales bacterium]
MRRCTYCGKEYDDTVTVCAIDRQPVVQVLPPPEGSSEQTKPPVEFIRLFFKSPEEEEFAVRSAQYIAGIVGERVTLLRPETTWSEILEWFGPSVVRVRLFETALLKKFGSDLKEVLTNPDFMTFRDFVEYACKRERKTA